MPDHIHQLGVYLHLARGNERRKQHLERDRMLLLAGVIAARMGLDSVAAYCRSEILNRNPGHILRRWETLARALEDDVFQSFVKQIQRRYPSENAERTLASWGVQMANERETYYSDAEYAAAVLGTTPEELDALYRNSGSE
jgi:hypothetical protein